MVARAEVTAEEATAGKVCSSHSYLGHKANGILAGGGGGGYGGGYQQGYSGGGGGY